MANESAAATFLSRLSSFSLRMAAATSLALIGAIEPAGAAGSGQIQEPPVFGSQNGLLYVLVIAAKRPNVQVGPVKTDLWTYEVCNLPSAGANACPAGSGQAGLGGVRLALQPGDTLRVRLVNKLPALTLADADHVADNPHLVNNATNLHTHGLIVSPHRAVGASDTYGDYVFLELDNPANPSGGGGAHPGMDVVSRAVEYLYKIEPSHPAGLFWFHPHLHGLSLNQVSAGMAGVITIGKPEDVCGDTTCTVAVRQAQVRHLVLKDTQVRAGGVLLTQQDPDFCAGAPAAPRLGLCAGQGPYAAGSWLNTVNGQVHPQIDVGARGDIWRIVSASGSRSYGLSVTNNGTGQNIPVQLIDIDGITINAKPGDSLATLQAQVGSKAVLVNCPGPSTSSFSQAVCATYLRMMPSSRVQIRVLRNDGGTVPLSATFKTAEVDTSDGALDGDHWPAIDLASVTLAPRDPAAPAVLALGTAAAAALSSSGQLLSPALVPVPGTGTLVSAAAADLTTVSTANGPALQDGLQQATSIAITPQVATGLTPASPDCQPLATGHHRRIYFGFPTDSTFGLGYVEVDQNGNEMEATRIPSALQPGVQPFDPVHPMVCVPLKNGNATYEVWELLNTTTEDHNFHIHQTRFYLLAGGYLPGETTPPYLNGSLVLQDNVMVPHPTPIANASSCDGTLEPVRQGSCKPTHTFVVIPFREVGDFVFHCHILEHEDGGMMARIRVVVQR